MSGVLPTSPIFASLDLKSDQPVLSDASESGKRQSRITGGHLWKMRLRYPPMTQAEFAPIDAFIMSQDGGYGDFDITYPLANQGTWLTDSPAIVGAHAAGVTSITVGGLTTGSMILTGTEVGAWLADTTAETVVGAELVTDGDMPSATNWTAVNATLSIVGGALRVTNVAGAQSRAYQAITCEVGRTYFTSVELTGDTSTGNLFLYIGTAPGVGDIVSKASNVPATLTASFVATQTTHYIAMAGSSTQLAGEYADWDNAAVKISDNDLSSNDHDLAYYGTITKSAVATGSDVMAYSGFSGSNYLQQGYDSSLDITSEVTVMAWVKFGHLLASQGIVGNLEQTADLGGYMVFFNLTNGISFLVLSDAGSFKSVVSPIDPVVGEWMLVTGTMNAAGLLSFYSDGVLRDTTAGGVIGATIQPLKVGIYDSTLINPNSGSIALARVLPSALTDNEIKNIYNAEKELFAANPDSSGLTIKAGDILRSENHTKVYKVIADAVAGADGEATVSVRPALIESLADGEALTVADVPFRMAIKDVHEFKISADQQYRYELDCEESL